MITLESTYSFNIKTPLTVCRRVKPKAAVIFFMVKGFRILKADNRISKTPSYFRHKLGLTGTQLSLIMSEVYKNKSADRIMSLGGNVFRSDNPLPVIVAQIRKSVIDPILFILIFKFFSY